eukprot:scpid39529/ scgid0683/ 
MPLDSRTGLRRRHCQPARVSLQTSVVLLLLLLLIGLLLPWECSAARRCPTVAQGRASGRFLNWIKNSKVSTCSVDSRHAVPSNRINCSDATCCSSSDCSLTNQLSWVCSCDSRCGVNRCFMLVGSCGRLSPPHGGYYVKEEDGYVKLRCKKGFKRVGPWRRQCKGGKWTDPMPHQCVPRCRTPDLPRHAIFMEQKVKKNYLLNDRIRAACKPGYKLTINKDFLLTCKYGRWKPRVERFRCVVDLENPCCQLPSAPLHGSVTFLTGHNTSLCKGQAFTYDCDECYTLAVGSARQDVCVQSEQVFSPPTCQRVTCQGQDIRLSVGTVLVSALDQESIHGCLSNVTVRCQGAHEATSKRQTLKCNSHGSWALSAGMQELHCTPSSVRQIHLEAATPYSLRLSWLPPSILEASTASYKVVIRHGLTSSSLPGWHNPRKNSYPANDQRFLKQGRFHVEINDLSAASAYLIEVTPVDTSGADGGQSNLRARTVVQSVNPVRCEVNSQRLYLVWSANLFPSDTVYKALYRTSSAVADPYVASGTERAAQGFSRVLLRRIQPYTVYHVQLVPTHSSPGQALAVNCSLESRDIVPRRPAAPSVTVNSSYFEVTLYPSADVFVQRHELIVRKYSRNIVQNSWKHEFSPAQLSPRHAPASLKFLVPDARPGGTQGGVFRFEVLAYSPEGQDSRSGQTAYFV